MGQNSSGEETLTGHEDLCFVVAIEIQGSDVRMSGLVPV